MPQTKPNAAGAFGGESATAWQRDGLRGNASGAVSTTLPSETLTRESAPSRATSAVPPTSGQPSSTACASGFFAAYAPGNGVLVYPDGYAKKLPKGYTLHFQIHYTPNGTEQTDRSSVGVIFAKKPPEYRAETNILANLLVKIPPKQANVKGEVTYTFQDDALLLSFMPHMHLRGKDYLIEAVSPEGNRETLLSIPRYDFNWQSVYRYTNPLPVPKGTKIHCVAHFDNSAKNPNNPDPTQEVRWGDQTWEEMMIGWYTTITYLDPSLKPDTAARR